MIFRTSWIENLFDFLNWISQSKKGLGGYEQLVHLVFILGLAKLIDLATGVNGQIIGTSNFWRFDFFTNLFYIVLSLPLNYFLIKNYGLEGLAYSNLMALTLYNSVRFGFLYYKFKFQPYTWKHAIFLLLCIGLMLSVYQLPSIENLVLNIMARTSLYAIGFCGIILFVNPAPEIVGVVVNFLDKTTKGFMKKK